MSTATATLDRRKGSRQAIENLVATRTDMLVCYSELAGCRPYSPCTKLVDKLQEFCQCLVDYTAEAHFRLYQYIETNRERRKAVQDVARAVYPRIADITQTILDFNDRYDRKTGCENLDSLERDLSRLGEQLAERIELEDQLIDAMVQPR